jgi:hypothetical protein
VEGGGEEKEEQDVTYGVSRSVEQTVHGAARTTACIQRWCVVYVVSYIRWWKSRYTGSAGCTMVGTLSSGGEVPARRIPSSALVCHTLQSQSLSLTDGESWVQLGTDGESRTLPSEYSGVTMGVQ